MTALKKVLDTLIFLERYDDIDSHMSDSSVGARKGRSFKNHLFIINGSMSKENQDEKLALLYESNKVNLVAVNTTGGLTSRINIPNIVQQGGTWGPALCSNSVDTIGKKIRDRGETSYCQGGASSNG